MGEQKKKEKRKPKQNTYSVKYFASSQYFWKKDSTVCLRLKMSLADQQASYYRDPDTGHLMCPGTKRPDGTWRKPRRIKEGYVPQDEVPLYESKGKQMAKARETNPIPGLPSNGGSGNGGIFNMKIDTFDHKALMGPPKIPGLPDSVQLAPSSIENAAKKPNKKKKKSAGSNGNSQTQSLAVKQVELEIGDGGGSGFDSIHHNVENADNVNTNVDPAKKLRNLRKKLRDIETLEKKLADGSVANPEPEQLEKVARKPVMLEEIADLEAAVAKLSTS